MRMAPSCCIRCTPRIGGASAARSASMRWPRAPASRSRACSISPHHEARGPLPRRHRQPGARSHESRGVCERLAAHASRRWSRNGRASSATSLCCSMRWTERARRSITRTCSCASASVRVVVGTGAIAPADRGRCAGAAARRAAARSSRSAIDEIEQFAGNMLELATWDEALGDCRVLVMSASARRRADARSLRTPQRLHGCACWPRRSPPSRDSSGGSVRCMLAEIFLPS